MSKKTYDPDKVDWVKTFAANSLPPGPITGAPPIIVLLDGTRVYTDDDQDPKPANGLSSEMGEHLQKRRGRPPGSSSTQRLGAKPIAPALPEALPAGGGVGEEEESPEKTAKAEKAEKAESGSQEPPMTKPRAQTLPGSTGTAVAVVREIPLEQIHEAIDQNLFESGVELRIQYKNNRGTPIFLTRTQVPLEALVSDLEDWLRSQWGGGTYRIDARDPASGKRALPIPVFEVSIHGPPRLASNGTVLPPGHTPSSFAAGAQGSSQMSGFQAPWAPATQGFGQPLVPGSVQVPQAPWGQAAAPAYGPSAHQVPVMSMPPDAIAMNELQKTQAALERERLAHAKATAEANKRFEALTAQINEMRLKEEDRARQLDAQHMRNEMRRMEEGFKAALEHERNRRPSFDLAALAGVVSAVVPVVTAMISTRSEQSSKAFEMQQSGINNLLKATLERGDSKWLEKLIGALPVLLPAVAPVFKLWAEQKSPAAQADLVATLSENHLTALSMMAKFMNEMAGAGPDQPAWVGVFQQMIGTVVSSIDSMVKSNKAAVGIPVQSQHFQQPKMMQPQIPQPAQPSMTPAQAAMGGMPTSAPTTPQNEPVLSIGAQVARAVMAEPSVPQDFKTAPLMKLIEDLHNKVDAELTAKFFADHLRELGDDVPKLLKEIWNTDEPEQLLQSVFVNLPIWSWDQQYTLRFIQRTVDILTTPAEGPDSTATTSAPVAMPTAASDVSQFFQSMVAAPA